MEVVRETTIHLTSQKRTLVIMAKAPKPGAVKTRLSKSLSSPAVLTLYRCLLEDTLTLAGSLPGVDVAVMCPASDQLELGNLLPDTVQIVAQKGEGLAAGLISVFARFATTGHHVIAFNADSPHLPASVLEKAFQALTAHDMVIGPTHDGGYYLVGAKAAHSTLFENDGLGTTSALERLLARARDLELSTGLTESFYDIDVVEDLIRLNTELRLAPARAPRTAAWFAEWKQTVANLASGTEEL
jgi:rSAM/selenodomain-associated transferase 1